MRNSKLRKMLLSACVFGVVATGAFAQNAAPAPATTETNIVTSGVTPQGEARLLVNKAVVITTGRPFKRINLGNPEVAEVNGIGTNKLLVTGKKAGTTQVIIFDEQDNSQMIDVIVDQDISLLRARMKRLLPTS